MLKVNNLDEKLDEIATYYSGGNEIVKSQLKDKLLNYVEWKIRSSPNGLKDIASSAEYALSEISTLNNTIHYKYKILSETSDPLIKGELQRQILELNTQLNSKLVHANDCLFAVKSNLGLSLLRTEILKIIEEFKKGKGSRGNNFLDPDFIPKLFDIFNHYLSTLNYEQNIAFINLSGIFTIMVTLISIIFIFYGNIILNYLNLETSYPKIAKIINLRRKFQQYYLF
jgi:hypothetical protein